MPLSIRSGVNLKQRVAYSRRKKVETGVTFIPSKTEAQY